MKPAIVTDSFTGGAFDAAIYQGTLATQNNGTLTQSGGAGRFPKAAAPAASVNSHAILITNIKGVPGPGTNGVIIGLGLVVAGVFRHRIR
jgi:hypothetical protein